MKCQWVIVKDRVYQCTRCGKVIAAAPGVEPKWDSMPDCQGPTVSRKAFNYAAAVVRWIEDGRPVRSDQETEQIISICKGCVHHMNNHCRLCGCRLRGNAALFSKLRMATEHCPEGKW